MEYAAKKNTIVKPSLHKEQNFFGSQREPAFFAPLRIQPKLTVGPVDDPYEREADAVADKVMRMSSTEKLQTKHAPVELQRKCASCEEEDNVQLKSGDTLVQRSPDEDAENLEQAENSTNRQQRPYLSIRFSLSAPMSGDEIDMVNYGEANMQLIQRGVINPADYSIPYAALWNNNYRLSTSWRLGTITKNLYDKGDALVLRPIRQLVNKIPLAGGFLSAKIKLDKPDLKGGDWDRYVADKLTLKGLGGALDRDKPAYDAGSGFTFTVNVVDIPFDENNIVKRIFRKPAGTDMHLSRKCADCEKEERVHRKGIDTRSATGNVPSGVDSVVNSSGQSLDAGTRYFMESRFGHDFGDVRIHDDFLSHQSSAGINALAFTHQNHIVFGAGQYNPGTDAGKKLLAHELTHVLQQSGKYPGVVQRQPATPPTFQDMELLVKAGKWCRDSKESGKLHPGQQCFREIPASKGHPPGEQHCYNINSPHEYMEPSHDKISAVSGQLPDGTCDIAMTLKDPPQPFTQRGRRSLGHFIGDVVREDADMIGTGYGAIAGISMGIALSGDEIGAGTIFIPAILGALGGLMARKGLPKLNALALEHGFLPTISLGLSTGKDVGLGVGLEQRRRPLPLIPVNTYLTFGFDTTLSSDDASFTANVGIRIDRAKQGGLFAFGNIGGGFRAAGTDTGAIGTTEAGLGYRFTDFMDVQVARENIYQQGDDSTIYWLTLKLVGPQNALKK